MAKQKNDVNTNTNTNNIPHSPTQNIKYLPSLTETKRTKTNKNELNSYAPEMKEVLHH